MPQRRKVGDGKGGSPLPPHPRSRGPGSTCCASAAAARLKPAPQSGLGDARLLPAGSAEHHVCSGAARVIWGPLTGSSSPETPPASRKAQLTSGGSWNVAPAREGTARFRIRHRRSARHRTAPGETGLQNPASPANPALTLGTRRGCSNVTERERVPPNRDYSGGKSQSVAAACPGQRKNSTCWEGKLSQRRHFGGADEPGRCASPCSPTPQTHPPRTARTQPRAGHLSALLQRKRFRARGASRLLESPAGGRQDTSLPVWNRTMDNDP